MRKFDAVIIGSGQGGNVLARDLADRGWKVAVIEKNKVGGSCVNYGCTPTKAMVASARRAYIARNSSEHGVKAPGVRIDFRKIFERKEKIVSEFRSGLERRFKKDKNITLYRGVGSFVSSGKVRAGKEIIEGKKIFINTGLRSVIPPIPGLAKIKYLDSTSLLELKALPRELIIIGGGYVGLEFGQMFSRFGSKVTIIQRGPKLAATEDDDIAGEIKNILVNEGISVYLEGDVTGVRKSGANIRVFFRHKGKIKFVQGSHVLVATGRAPDTAGLNLAAAGVKMDERGFIKVNSRLETNVPNIWAIGDVKGGPAFTHVSTHDYEIVFGNLVQGKKMTNKDYVPVYAMFIDPSLGRAGLTEREAREKGYDVLVAEYPMAWVPRAIELGETAGKIKLVVDKKTEKILGAAILGYEGAELVQIISAYMSAGADYKTVQRTVVTHPTLAEGIQNAALELPLY